MDEVERVKYLEGILIVHVQMEDVGAYRVRGEKKYGGGKYRGRERCPRKRRMRKKVDT